MSGALRKVFQRTARMRGVDAAWQDIEDHVAKLEKELEAAAGPDAGRVATLEQELAFAREREEDIAARAKELLKRKGDEAVEANRKWYSMLQQIQERGGRVLAEAPQGGDPAELLLTEDKTDDLLAQVAKAKVAADILLADAKEGRVVPDHYQELAASFDDVDAMRVRTHSLSAIVVGGQLLSWACDDLKDRPEHYAAIGEGEETWEHAMDGRQILHDIEEEYCGGCILLVVRPPEATSIKPTKKKGA